MTDDDRPLIRTRFAMRAGGLAAVIGLGALAIGAAFTPGRAAIAYLFAYASAAAIAIGGLILMLIGHAANARWPAALRRVNESITVLFPVLALLFVPIVAALPYFYVWADPDAVLPAGAHHVLEAKRAWLEAWPFTMRATAYLAVFAVTAEVLRSRSRARDRVAPTDPERAIRRDRMFAAAALPVVGLAVTFLAFDWVMSLQPTWYSSMFGIYYFAGGFAAGIATVAILAWRARPIAAGTITPHHFHALGRLLLAFVVFWGYAAYFQGFLIAIADRPIEVTFYRARLTGGWDVVLAIVLVVHFALPFLLLLPRMRKLRPRYVAGVAGIVVAGHIFDLYWVIVPAADPIATPSWLDIAALVGVGGACVAWAAWRQRGVPAIAVNEPYLQDAIGYASPT
jgi:hypothetical protein